MAVEIERKFLVIGDAWRVAATGTSYRQGYLCNRVDCSVRIRTGGNEAWLTIKGETVGMTRQEFEYPIPLADAEALLALCQQPLIEKVRYRVEHAGHVWEVDEFASDNAGLVVAEIELHSADQLLELPDWVGEEVTLDPRYYNASLQLIPYRLWSGQSDVH
jgi:CYTH domain-containing protein